MLARACSRQELLLRGRSPRPAPHAFRVGKLRERVLNVRHLCAARASDAALSERLQAPAQAVYALYALSAVVAAVSNPTAAAAAAATVATAATAAAAATAAEVEAAAAVAGAAAVTAAAAVRVEAPVADTQTPDPTPPATVMAPPPATQAPVMALTVATATAAAWAPRLRQSEGILALPTQCGAQLPPMGHMVVVMPPAARAMRIR